MNEVPIGYVLSDDLLFSSKITSTARALGLETKTCRTPQLLLSLAGERNPACVFLDVHFPQLNIAELVAGLKAKGTPYIVGYGSHVAVEVLKQARAAGCDLVLPKSQFVADLPTKLSAWFGTVAKTQEPSKP